MLEGESTYRVQINTFGFRGNSSNILDWRDHWSKFSNAYGSPEPLKQHLKLPERDGVPKSNNNWNRVVGEDWWRET